MKRTSKYTDRREASGKLKPRLFLLMEMFIMLSIVVIIHFVFDIRGLTIVSLFAVLFIFFISSIARYKKVIERQKYSKYD